MTYDPISSPRLEGTTATHSCNSGYGLFGERERMCQSDRTWSGEIVTYNGKLMGKNHVFSPRFFNVAITCPPLADSLYGLISYSTNTSPYLFGTQATYTITCPLGQERSGGDDVRICLGDGHSTVGVWTGTAPICAGW